MDTAQEQETPPTAPTAEVAASLHELADLLASGELGAYGGRIAAGIARMGHTAGAYSRDQLATLRTLFGGEPEVVGDSIGTSYFRFTRMVGVIPLRLEAMAKIVGERRVVGTETVDRVEWVLTEDSEEVAS